MISRIPPGLTARPRIDRLDVDAVAGRASGRRRGAMLPAIAYVLLAMGTVLLIPGRPASDRLADLQVYRGAAQALRDGADLYGFHAANGDPFTYPPFAGLLMLPLAWVPGQVAAVSWTTATLVAVAWIGHIAVAGVPSAIPAGGRRRTAWVFGVVLLASAPAQSNVRFGQISVFVVLVTLLDVTGRLPDRWAGVAVGMAAAVKLTPLLFVVHLVAVGRLGQARRAIVTFVACIGLGWLVLPDDSIRFWSSAVFRTERIGDLTDPGNQSLCGILLRSGLAPLWQSTGWLIGAILICALALWRARSLHRCGEVRSAAIVTGCATIAASPVSWTHHQFWPVLAAVVLVASRQRRQAFAGCLLMALWTLAIPRIGPEHAGTSDYVSTGWTFLAVNARGITTVALAALGAGLVRRGVPQARPILSAAGRHVAARRVHSAGSVQRGLPVLPGAPRPEPLSGLSGSARRPGPGGSVVPGEVVSGGGGGHD